MFQIIRLSGSPAAVVGSSAPMRLARGLMVAACGAQMIGSAMALDCRPLEPRSGADVSQEVKGKIDGKIDGIFAKLAGATASGDVFYKQTRDDVLKEYPNASDTYIKERLIYLKCSSLQDTRLNADELQNQLNSFIQEILKNSNKEINNIQKIGVINTTYYSSDNEKIIELLDKNDGKIIYIDTINADLATDENFEIFDNCFGQFSKKIKKDRVLEGYLNGANLPLPTESDREGKQCPYAIILDSLDERPYPTSSGGTGIVNILVRKAFLVNKTGAGYMIIFNLREK